MKKIGWSMACVTVCLLVASYAAADTWIRTYGNTGDDNTRCILQTADGGYFMAGNTATEGTLNAWAAKLGPDVCVSQQMVAAL